MDTNMVRLFPPFALRVRTGTLELRCPTDADLAALAELAVAGIHDPAEMPFFFPWTDVSADQLPNESGRHHWRKRAEFSVDSWALLLAVRHDGDLVGVQGFETMNYLVTRTGETGSWLGRRYQGRGIGTTMRRAVCALAFDHLDAQQVTSGAFTDNPASRAVSRKVGYTSNGFDRVMRRDQLAVMEKLVLTPERFVRGDVTIEVEGVSELRRFIGLDASDGGFPSTEPG